MSDLNYVIGDQGQTTAVAVYPTTVQSATITTSGFPVQITVTGDGEPNGSGWHRLQIYRDSTPIGEILHVEASGSGNNVTVAMVHVDTPVAGTYTYKANVVNGSGVSIIYTEVGQLNMIVEEKIISSYFANNWLRRDINPPDVYYGYSTDYNAADGDAKWSIKKVTVSGTVETVTWTNGNPKSAVSIWDDRVDCFISPSGPIGLTGNAVTLSGNLVLQLGWSLLSGVDSYQIVVADADKGTIFTDGGYVLYSSGYNSMLTYEVFSKDNYTYTKPEIGKTYSVTVTAVNVTGNIDETVTIST